MFNVNATEAAVGGETSQKDDSTSSSQAVVPNTASETHNDAIKDSDKIATTIDHPSYEGRVSSEKQHHSVEADPFSSVELPDSVHHSVVPSHSVPQDNTPESENTPVLVPPPSSTWVATVLPSTSQLPTTNGKPSSKAAEEVSSSKAADEVPSSKVADEVSSSKVADEVSSVSTAADVVSSSKSAHEWTTGPDEIVYETSTHWRDISDPQSASPIVASTTPQDKSQVNVVSSSEQPSSPQLSTIQQTSEQVLTSQFTKRQSTSEFSNQESTSEFSNQESASQLSTREYSSHGSHRGSTYHGSYRGSTSQGSTRESASQSSSGVPASSSSDADTILSAIDSAYSGLLSSLSSSQPVTLTPTSSASTASSGPSATPSSFTRHRHSASSQIAETDASKASSSIPFPWFSRSSTSGSSSSATLSERSSSEEGFFSIIRSALTAEPSDVPSTTESSSSSSVSQSADSSTESATPASVAPPNSSSGSDIRTTKTITVTAGAQPTASSDASDSGSFSASASSVSAASSTSTDKPIIPTGSSFWSSVFAPQSTASSNQIVSSILASGSGSGSGSAASASGSVASVATPPASVSGSVASVPTPPSSSPSSDVVPTASASRVVVPPISSGSSVPISSLFGTTTRPSRPSYTASGGVSSGIVGTASPSTTPSSFIIPPPISSQQPLGTLSSSNTVGQSFSATGSSFASSGSIPVVSAVPTMSSSLPVVSAVAPASSSGLVSGSLPVVSASASASGVSSFSGLQSGASSTASGSSPVVANTQSSTPLSTGAGSSYTTVQSASPSTSDWLPAMIITQNVPTVTSVPGSSNTASPASSTPSSSGVPSSLPKAIAPSNPPTNPPKDSQVIQIGFDKPLNYPFVVDHPLAVAQIFRNLPMGLGYGLSLDASNVSMVSVQPYESDSADYLVTVALAYIPKSLVQTLDALIHTPSSQLYRDPDQGVASLMNLIDPTIPLIPGSSGDITSAGSSGSSQTGGNGSSGSGSGSDGGNGDVSGSSGNNGAGNNGNNSGSLDQTAPESKVNTKTVGITVGAIAGAAAYVGAIFFVAKRYREKRNSLVLEGSDEGSIGSRFFDDQSISSGNTGIRSNNSSRLGGSIPIGQQPISKPVMSENSLGWA
ncbi:signaling mucin Msb2p [Trichomonascus vanleenenianus]|uniref:signaling mucin Msb2p n=1 Tax=Trichomonascus vanleenenianus TaxID=2268995 RepID=UPI003EC9E559